MTEFFDIKNDPNLFTVEELNNITLDEQTVLFRKKYHEVNKEKIAMKAKAYSQKNKEYLNLYSKGYNEVNKEEVGFIQPFLFLTNQSSTKTNILTIRFYRK
jgi:hypothetical protein